MNEMIFSHALKSACGCLGVFRISDRQAMKRKAAFSLVEMLMALLVASLLLAALAPVITKRLANENVSFSGGGGVYQTPGDMRCWYTGDSTLIDGPDGTKVTAEPFVLPDGMASNRIGIILAAGGGGGAAASQKEVITGNTLNDITTEKTITAEMDDFVITTMTGGGGGGGGGAGHYVKDQFTANATSCGKITGTDTTGHTGNYATFDGMNNLCVTKYNQVSNPTTYTTYAKINGYTDTNCTSNYTHTSSRCNSNQNSMPYAYSGCKRPVCTHAGAEAACAKLKEMTGMDWELPKNDDIKEWGKTIAGHDYPVYVELALCTGSGSGTPFGQVARCNDGESVVFSGARYPGGADIDWCAYPNRVWAKEATDTTLQSYYRGYLTTSYGTSYDSAGQPSSVRCVVREALTEVFNPLSGGQGGSSPVLVNLTKDNSQQVRDLNSAIKSNVGGTIQYVIGTGGKGADKITEKDTKAKDANGTTGKGTESCIIVKKQGGAEQFRLCVPGGNPGKGADGRMSEDDIKAGKAYGKGGDKVEANSCYTVDSRSGSPITNTFPCAEGAAGITGKTATGYTVAEMDAGSVLDGKSGDLIGAGKGGGGGYATKQDDSSGGDAILTFGKGGDGARGTIQMTYTLNYEAAGGGGGGAGFIAHIKNFRVEPGRTACEIKVGGGGAGGQNPGAAGLSGKYSSIKCSNNNVEYKVPGGKGGKVGTSAEAGGSGGGKGGEGGAAGVINDRDSYDLLFRELVRDDATYNYYKGNDGLSGANTDSVSGSPANYKYNRRSAGGRGGTSVANKGKCGGLTVDAFVCNEIAVDADNEITPPLDLNDTTRLNGHGFEVGDTTYPTKNNFNKEDPKFVETSAGGGGGAWHVGMTPGKGGNGQGGYVCIYWDDPNSGN